MQPGFNDRAACFNFAGNPFADCSLRPQRDGSRFRLYAVLFLQRGLKVSEFFWFHENELLNKKNGQWHPMVFDAIIREALK
jgi:hypothetical protein